MTYIVNRASAGARHASIHCRNGRLRRALTNHQGGVATGIAASSGSVIMHRKKAVTFAAVLLLGSASAGFAQGTGGRGAPTGGPAGAGIGNVGVGGSAPTPGIGVGGRAPTPGTGMGGAPTPGIGTGGSMNSSDTLPGNPSGTAPRASPGNPSVPTPRAAPKIG